LAIADGLRFVLELAGIAAAAYWGWNAGGEGVTRWLLAIAAPAILIVTWAMFIAPKADSPLSPTVRIVVGSVLLLVTAGGLWLVGQQNLGVAFAVVIVLDTVATLALRR
jgi:hypothetical protein